MAAGGAVLVVVVAAMVSLQIIPIKKMSANNNSSKRQQQNASHSIMLPDDTISHILSYLNFNQLAKCSSVSTNWKNAVSRIDEIHIGLDHHNVEQMRFATSGIFQKLTSAHIYINFDLEDESKVILGDRILSDRIGYFFKKCRSTIRRVHLDGRGWDGFTCDALQAFNDAHHLEELRMHHCRFRTVDALVNVLQSEKLKVLHWQDCNFNVYCLKPKEGDCQTLSERVE